MKFIKTLLGLLFLSPHVAWAQRFPQIEPIWAYTSLTTLARNIVNWLTWLAGVVAVAFLVYGGIVYITAGGNEDKAKIGKNIVLQSIIGIVIIILAYLIILWVIAIVTAGQT